MSIVDKCHRSGASLPQHRSATGLMQQPCRQTFGARPCSPDPQQAEAGALIVSEQSWAAADRAETDHIADELAQAKTGGSD